MFLRPAAPADAVPRTRLSVVERLGLGLGVDAMAFPGELALLLRVALPLASHRARLAAVGFAIEDMIAEPLEAVHVALGPELATGEYLAAVVRRADMALWAPRARAARQRLTPDVLALPVPSSGGWSVRENAGRVLVRRADGAGFATRADAFELFWRAAQTPQIVLYGGRLPEGLPVGASGLMPSGPLPEAATFDLLQGRYAHSGSGGRRAAAWLGGVLALTVAAHAGVLAAETHALWRIADAREAALRDALGERLPELPAGVPLEAALGRALPAAGAGGGGFLPLLAAVAATLQPHAGDVALRNLGYSAADGSLSIMLEAPDLATLQRIETALAAAGLAVASGVATTGDGAAEVRYVIGWTGG